MDDTLDVGFAPTAHDELPRLLAARLYDYMRARGWKFDRHRKGASELKRLIDEHGEREVIRRVNGYVNHGVTRPVVRACQDFREQWAWIGDQVKRAEAVARSDVSEDAKRIVRDLMELVWPDKAVAQLPAVVETSLRAARAFAKHLTHFRGSRDAVDAARGLAEQLAEPETAVAQWFRGVHRRLSAFADWKGDVSGQAWDAGNPRVAARMTHMLVARGDDESTWAEIVKGL